MCPGVSTRRQTPEPRYFWVLRAPGFFLLGVFMAMQLCAGVAIIVPLLPKTRHLLLDLKAIN